MPTLSITPRMYFAAWHSGNRSFVVDAVIALVVLGLVVFAMIALIALLGSADPNTAAAAAADGPMVILPP